MRLTVLGCAGSFPGPESACSAYLVEADGFRLLVDFGTGSLSALQRYSGLHARRRHPADPPALRPHARRVRLHRGPTLRARRPLPADCRSTRRPARRTGSPPRYSSEDERRARRRVHLLRPAAGHLPDRPVPGHRRPGQPPGRDLRRAASSTRAGCWPTRRTPRRATRCCAWRTAPTCSSARRATSTAPTTRPTCT